MNHKYNQLFEIFQFHFNWNLARVSFLTTFVISFLQCSTVNLRRVALRMKSQNIDSNYRRIQNFFQKFALKQRDYSLFLKSLLPKDGKYWLAIDRTNWKFGKTDINILMIVVIYKEIAFPLCWMALEKFGNSSSSERITLLEKAVKILGKDSIKGILGDREFIGIKWFRYLMKEEIGFHIRVKSNTKVGSKTKENRKEIKDLLKYFKVNIPKELPNKYDVFGYKLHVSGMKTEDDYCIVISNKDNTEALKIYRQRWSIENMFGAFKTRGFNFEDTHLSHLYKIEKLIFLISIAYVWSIFTSLWLDSKVTIRENKYGKKTISYFRRGLDYLINMLYQILLEKTNNDYNEVFELLSCT